MVCERFSVLACLIAWSSLALLFPTERTNAEDQRSNGVVERLPGGDPSCDAVNRAYQNTVNQGRLQDTIYSVQSDSKSLFAENRWIGRTLWSHSIRSQPWRHFPRKFQEPMDDGRPVFTDCRAANAPGSKSLEYEARWERYGYKALAYVWIEDGRLTRVERHFDPHGSPFPFDVSLDVFTDDVSLREPIGEQPEPLDDSCFDVNAAFRRTVDTPRVMKSTWGQNPVREQVMVLDNALYLKKNGSWRRHDLPLQALTTPQGAMFHLCVRQAANEKEVYYSAWLLEAGTSIPIDMWVSVETGKFTRTSRNYSPTGQMYHTRTVEQVFDYNPSGATMPQQYSPDIPLPDIWAADSDLR